ncbi:MAG: hypothetical protein ICV66_11960, partial [Chitinophagaceae bacterium]|nr:hypothetical protein [Chitinophagaceae bacterium]
MKSADANDPKVLAQELTSASKTDYDKVRSIFTWITDNIAYKTQYGPAFGAYKRYTPPADASLDSKSVDEIVACKVLSEREALCDGYARLFKTLCDYSDIHAEIVRGYVRSS